jgi:hypothetical protein
MQAWILRCGPTFKKEDDTNTRNQGWRYATAKRDLAHDVRHPVVYGWH